MIDNRYHSLAQFVCYEGEGTQGELPASNGGGSGASGGSGDGEVKPPADFTPEQQKKFNEALAADRRKHKMALESAERQMQELLKSKGLSDEERLKTEQALEDLRAQMRTKEQQLAHEKKQLEEHHTKTLAEVTQKAQHWETRYRESTMARALQDAAMSGDAFRPEQIVTILRPMAKLSEESGEFRTMIEFPDTDVATGEPVKTLRTPEDAVKRMKELPEVYGNLFKSNVVSGIGANSATGGLTSGKDGKVDLKKVAQDPVLYRRLRKEHPELLGL